MKYNVKMKKEAGSKQLAVGNQSAIRDFVQFAIF